MHASANGCNDGDDDLCLRMYLISKNKFFGTNTNFRELY